MNRWLAICALGLLSLTGCAGLGRPQRQYKPLGSVLIQKFTCEDPIIAEAVQNVFVTELAAYGMQLVRTGASGTVIEGTITLNNDMASSHGAFVAGGTAAGSGRLQAGRYVTGVSALVMKHGAFVAGATESQTRGSRMVKAPEELAERAASRLRFELQRAGFLPRRKQ